MSVNDFSTFVPKKTNEIYKITFADGHNSWRIISDFLKSFYILFLFL